MKNCLRVMKALSDPNRIKILKLITKKEMCVCEIKELLNLAQPTISKHLKILEDAGLADKRKDKSWVNYRAADGTDSIYAKAMLAEFGNWLNDDHEIINLLKKASTVDRITLCAKASAP